MNAPSKERKYGLDLLRILSMMGIIGLHIINNGGWLTSADTVTETAIARFITSLCYCSVNIFAMLTGYLYCTRSSIRSSNLIKLLFIVAVYCITILVVFVFWRPELFQGYRGLYLYSLFPPLIGRYWYITCYVLLFMLIPYLNTMIRNLSQISFSRMLIILSVLLSAVSTFGLTDYFKIGAGYSPYWLIYCYFIGAYLRLYPIHAGSKTTMKLLTVLALDLLVLNIAWYLLGDNTIRRKFLIIDYISPFIVLEAAILLSIFSRITIRHNIIRRCVVSLSNGAFGVYIIHSHLLVFDYVLQNAFSWPGKLGGYVGILFVGVIGIYLVCWVIDYLRNLLFNFLRINSLGDKIGNALDKYLHW